MAVLDIGNLGATGTADLATQLLNLQANAVLSKAFSQQVGGGGSRMPMVGCSRRRSRSSLSNFLTHYRTFTGPESHAHWKMAQHQTEGLDATADNPLGGASSILVECLVEKGSLPPYNPIRSIKSWGCSAQNK